MRRSLPESVTACSERLDPDLFLDTIQPCRLEGIESNTLIISAPDQKSKKRLIQQYLGLFEELARGQKNDYRIRILARGKNT